MKCPRCDSTNVTESGDDVANVCNVCGQKWKMFGSTPIMFDSPVQFIETPMPKHEPKEHAHDEQTVSVPPSSGPLRWTTMCSNESCRYFAVTRRVSAQYVGVGVFTLGTVYCECGADLIIQRVD